jgi:hypothetical protein
VFTKGGKLKKNERCTRNKQIVANERNYLGAVLENRG